MAEHIDLPGQSGKNYRYFFLKSIAAADVKKEAGNYIFTKPGATAGKEVVLYIGQADDLSRRLSTHERWEEAKRVGATRVYAHLTQGGESVRCAEERDLIQRWNPPLNVQHRKLG